MGYGTSVSSWEYFLYLVSETCGFTVFFLWFPAVTLVLVAAFVAAIVYVRAPHPHEWLRKLAICVIPALIPTLILWVGVAFVESRRVSFGDHTAPPQPWFDSTDPKLPDDMVGGLFVSGFLLMAILVMSTKTPWKLWLSSGLWWGWISFVASLPTKMSTSGQWF